MSVNVRIDGVLQHVITITHKDFLQYDAKLKFISGIKINVVQLPQDGRFTFDYTVDGKTRPIDVRLNTMPSLYGDDIVMRFLDMGETVKSFDSLGIRSMHYDIIKKALQEQNGMILVTGPTGSGKTTTLYAMLNHVNDGTKKIITLENPIEYQLPGIQQSQINEDE
ncbi:MAG: Flp pilus assembly complex ATPase component TadA [Candidatus Peribacteria bacterium]|nr:MAG: Flp pilus assembly complex ATPase component TadA [Candidatus Peribacteria bacterium]